MIDKKKKNGFKIEMYIRYKNHKFKRKNDFEFDLNEIALM